MKFEIPTLGLISLTLAGFGCSDAQKVAQVREKICKARCGCPAGIEDWNSVRNCKKACRGLALDIEVDYAEREASPCGELDGILDDLEDCLNETCNELYNCVYERDDALRECWPRYSYGGGHDGYDGYNGHDGYDGYGGDQGAEPSGLMTPIPEALPEATLHSATYAGVTDAPVSE